MCCLTACSGSTGTDQPQNSADYQPSSPDPLTPPLDLEVINGVVLIQENKGKRIVDAFFSEIARFDEPGMLLWQDGTSTCHLQDKISDTATSQGLHPVIDSTFFAGSSIDFHDRTGRFLTLEPQALGNAVVYSTDDRWIDTDLPPGTQLSLSDSDWFPETVGIELYPMQPIKVVDPESNILPGSGSTLSWEIGTSDRDKIQIVFTAPYQYRKTDSNTAVQLSQVYCETPDNGSFELPADIRTALGNPDSLHFSVTRRRSSELQHQGSILSVLQISNAP